MAIIKKVLHEHLEKRDKALDKLISELKDKIQEYQQNLYNKLLDNLASDYDIDDVIIDLNKEIDNDREIVSFLAWYRNEVRKINALPSEYFYLYGIERDFDVESPVRTYMSEFTKNIRNFKSEIKSFVGAIVLASTSRTEIRNGIKDRLIGDKRRGFVESKLLVPMRDSAIESMRAIDARYAQKHDMEYIFYAGGRMETSRCFCVQRYDKIWSLKKVDSWNDLSWAGKIDGVNVRVAAGGYNCIHSLLPVTHEEAEKFGYDEGYNSC